MWQDPFFYLITGSMALVMLVLFAGLISFAIGGSFNRRWSNRLMRARVATQFIAVAIIVLFAWLHSGGN